MITVIRLIDTCLQYVLESYTEARSTSEATEAYTLGQYLDRYTVVDYGIDFW